MEGLRRLECIQIDPFAAVHLVLSARLPGYRPEELDRLLDQRQVFEYIANAACVIPMEDDPLFAPMRQRLQAPLEGRLQALKPVVEHVLKREGPLPARAFSSTERVHGYWDHQAPKTKATFTHSTCCWMRDDSSGREKRQRTLF